MLRLRSILVATVACTVASAQQYRVQSYVDRDEVPCTQAYDAVQGPDGRMWFATRLGVTDYDGAHWGVSEGIGQPQRYLGLDDDGGIWAVTSYAPLHVARFDGTSWIDHGTDTFATDPFPTDLVGVNATRAYIGTFRHGVVMFDAGTWTTLPDADDGPVHANALARVDGQLLVGTPDGLIAYDEGDLSKAPRTIAGARTGVLGMARDRGAVWVVGSDWIGRYENGELRPITLDRAVDFNTTRNLCPVVPDGGGGALVADGPTIHHVRHDGRLTALDVATPLPFYGSNGMALDREHNIWLTSDRGICRLTRSEVRSYSAISGLLESEVSAICRRGDGTMVLGHNGGISLFADHRSRPIPFDAPPVRGRVLDLEPGDGNEVWIAASWLGLGRLDEDDRCTFWKPDATGQVHAIARRDGELWVAGDFGLMRFDGETFSRADGDPPLLHKRARRLSGDDEGNLWMSTSLHGVIRYGRDGKIRQWSSDNGIERSTYGVAHLPDGRTLVASSGGLLQLGEHGLEPAPEATRDRPVYFVLPGQLPGELWLGSNAGIVFRDANGQRRISRSDGLLGDEANRDGALDNGDGRLWVGTDGGLNLVPGPFLSIRPARPTVEMLRVEHDGKPVPLEDGIWQVPADPGETRWYFRAISFFDEDRIRCYYQLEGLHDDWVGPTSLPTREIYFASLAPGTYRLRLFVEGADNQRSDEFVSRPMFVATPLTQRWWFLALAGTAILGLGALGFREYSQRRYARRLSDEVERRTEQLAATQRQLAQDREQLERTLDSIGDAVIATDPMCEVFLWNDAACALTGIDERAALGRNLRDLLPELGELPDEGPFVWDDLKVAGRVRTFEGTVAPLGTLGAGAVIAFRDVTDRHLLEREVAHRQRLESLGQLAGGIAHDFNNYLTVLNGTLDMLVDEASLTPEQRSQASVARSTLRRAVSLTQQLLTFSRGGTPVRRAVDLEALIHDAVAFALSGSPIEAKVAVARGLPHADVDEGQIAQALHNLLLNARQILTRGGTVRIEARVPEPPPTDLDGDDWIELQVSDDGPGMPADVRAKVFDPFFSAREGGTGLGLSVVHSIVNRHGGRASVTSEPGAGTTFRLLLPAARQAAASERAPAPVAPERARVLVMDDDDNVRRLLVRMLEHIGHECVATRRGEDAVDEYAKAVERGPAFDAVLLDLTVVGGLGGRATADRLLQLDGDARLVAISGYSDEGTMGDFAKAGFCAALAKPFDREGLRSVIERATSGG
ncbi:MAG: ATP-binding protein [Planctomycetota bacterium]